jgi:hypothetical protein
MTGELVFIRAARRTDLALTSTKLQATTTGFLGRQRDLRGEAHDLGLTHLGFGSG